MTWTKSGAHVGPPKTDAGVRTVSIPPHIRPVLAAHLDSFVPDGPEALLFPAAPGSTAHMRQTTFADHFKRAVLLTSLPATFRFHWLRHTGLTLAAQAGATLAKLSTRAGHSTTSTVMRYQHATAARDDALAHALSRLASEADSDLRVAGSH